MLIHSANNWWIIGLKGLLLILIGLFAMTQPATVVQTLANLFGTLVLLLGIVLFVSAMRKRQKDQPWAWPFIQGMFNFIFGLILLFIPKFLLLLIGMWIFADGAMQLAAAFQHRAAGLPIWRFIGFSGMFSALIGLFILLNPFGTAMAVTVLLGAVLLTFGVVMVILALELRKASKFS